MFASDPLMNMTRDEAREYYTTNGIGPQERYKTNRLRSFKDDLLAQIDELSGNPHKDAQFIVEMAEKVSSDEISIEQSIEALTGIFNS